MRHGTGTAYNRGCRCEVCAVFHRQRCAEARDARLAEREWTGNGYTNYGCRCGTCSVFNAQRGAEWKARRRVAS